MFTIRKVRRDQDFQNKYLCSEGRILMLLRQDGRSIRFRDVRYVPLSSENAVYTSQTADKSVSKDRGSLLL